MGQRGPAALPEAPCAAAKRSQASPQLSSSPASFGKLGVKKRSAPGRDGAEESCFQAKIEEIQYTQIIFACFKNSY